MATDSGGSRSSEEIKTHFTVREGTYNWSQLSEYSRPNRTIYNEGGNASVYLSFSHLHSGLDCPEKVCFNVGKELYIYPFKGLKKAADLTQPTDKKVYKGTFPTCHAFSEPDESNPDDSLLLLVGFSAGQIQLIDTLHREPSILYNQERSIEKSKVTCVSWLPHNKQQFLVSHASGSLYIYSQDSICSQLSPTYQIFKQGEGYMVFTCKTKSSRNPMFKWAIGDGGAIYEFRFSPCNQYLAVVTQDGYLRIFDFNRMEMVGYMKSYFGGLHCVSWSPDGRYLATGGEDDLITVYSFHENRVICRGRGHRSWVTCIEFDPYNTLTQADEVTDKGSDDESLGISHLSAKCSLRDSTRSSTSSRFSIRLDGDGNAAPLTTYRIGSVSQDTSLCLWDITSDILYSHTNRIRTNSYITSAHNATNLEINIPATLNCSQSSSTKPSPNAGTSNSTPTLATLPSPSLLLGNGVKAKKNFSLSYKDKNSIRSTMAATQLMRSSVEQFKLLGTQYCPKLEEVPLLEPLTCKKLSHNMLTTLHFYRDFIVVSCQDGIVSSYARPHKQVLGNKSNESSDAQLRQSSAVNHSYTPPSHSHMNGDSREEEEEGDNFPHATNSSNSLSSSTQRRPPR